MAPISGADFTCTRVEIIPTFCSIAEPYIELDHGSVSSTANNGQTVSSTFKATCNQNFELSIIAKDEKGEVPLVGGLISHLIVNGDDLGVGYTEVVCRKGKLL